MFLVFPKEFIGIKTGTFSSLSGSESATYIMFFTSFHFILPLQICHYDFTTAEFNRTVKKLVPQILTGYCVLYIP